MRYLLPALLAPLITAQQLIPQNLPSCVQQCPALQQGQTGCTPAGGAPVTSQGTYQSCFCQSALLTQLYSPNPIQFCSTCSTTDMSTIQNWYKSFCERGGAPVANNGQQPAPPATLSTSTIRPTNSPTSGARTTDPKGSTESDEDEGPWYVIRLAPNYKNEI